MSLFPRFNSEFTPIFRLLEDYDRYSRSNLSEGASSLRSFTPKFDVREHKEHYELHGELPGIDEKNIQIEWADGNTLHISGRTEHRSERGTPAGFIEENAEKSKEHEYQKPTVEDEEQQEKKPNQEVAKKESSSEVTKPQADAPKYWVTERSVGEFHRSFSFPARVDQDNVKANLKNGILTITVPKAKRAEPRKIAIQVESA